MKLSELLKQAGDIEISEETAEKWSRKSGIKPFIEGGFIAGKRQDKNGWKGTDYPFAIAIDGSSYIQIKGIRTKHKARQFSKNEIQNIIEYLQQLIKER